MTQRLTIQAFPTSIRIVTLLLSPPSAANGGALHPLAHNLLARLIAFAPLHSPEFFAIISNDVEVGVYAAAEMVRGAVVEARGWAMQEPEEGWIEVMEEEWRVLQVDGEQVGQDGGQDDHSSIHPVTASLADAGIHCKYQSSYYADFILVKDEQYEQTVALVRACGWTIEDGPSTPNTPSPMTSFCPRHITETRGHNANRYSTSSLPVVASNEWITYHDTATPVTLGATEVKSSRRRARPHTADEVFGIGKEREEQGSMTKKEGDRRPLSSLRSLRTAEAMPKIQRGFDCPNNATTPRDAKEQKHEGAKFLDDAEDAREKNEEHSLASSGVLSHLSMAVDFAPALASDFHSLAVSEATAVSKDAKSDARPSLQSLTIRLSDDANTLPTAIAPVSATSNTDAPPQRHTFRVFVSVLSSKIAVVGLNKETERQWEHRVQVFLNYPEEQARVENNRYSDVLAAGDHNSATSRYTEDQDSTTTTSKERQVKRPFISYIRTEDGTSLSTEIPIIRSLFQVDEREGLVQSGGELGIFDDDEDEEEGDDARRDRSGGFDRGCSSFPGPAHAREANSPASSCRDMFDSGYGSAFGAPPSSRIKGYNDTGQAGGSTENADAGDRMHRTPERGVKRCLQLDFRPMKSDRSLAEDDRDGARGLCLCLEQTKLIARVSGRLQSRGLGLLYASTYRSANIMVESPYLQTAQKVLEEVVWELDAEACDTADEEA